MNRIACAVMCFNRPNYLKQVIESILNNENYNNFDWFFYQDDHTIDGIKYADHELINESTNIILKNSNKFKFFTLFQADENIGVARQKQKAHQLFKEYENVIFFEDDMILSPYYLHLLVTINKQFSKCIVQANDRTGGLPKDNFTLHLNELIPSWCHWWGYLMPYDIYKQIQEGFDYYVNFIGPNYRKRPSKAIKQEFNVGATSHDAILSLYSEKSNIQKLTTVVPRAKYIGERGLHARPEWYKKFKFNIEKPYIFEEDKDITFFKLKG